MNKPRVVNCIECKQDRIVCYSQFRNIQNGKRNGRCHFCANQHVKYWLGKKRPSPSIETRMKLSKANKGKQHSEETRRILSEQRRGDKSSNWKGGISEKNEFERHGVHYKLWRESVFKRDDYTCQDCGARGGYLNADHIKPFAFYPELRYAIDNGKTLCIPCHAKTPTYGNKVHKYMASLSNVLGE